MGGVSYTYGRISESCLRATLMRELNKTGNVEDQGV
jgi:hypothetical protein